MKAFQAVLFTSFACARYTEERLDEALARGVDQFLIIGAGLDSFALRRRDLEDRPRIP
jgi:O-methyltransferase involved in polyketide biosynthesis